MTALTPATGPSSAIFTDAITLKQADPEVFDAAFTAVTQPCPWPKAYGGDLVAQAAVAAQRTVDDGKTLHSMHSYFMRPADIGAEVRYEVELLRDGRGYSTRQVRAFQRGKALYACLASFAAGEQGGAYAAEFPPGIPGPETLPSAAQYLAGRDGGTMTAESKAYWSQGRGFDLRHVPGPVYLTVDGARVPQQAVWVRPFDALRAVNGLTSAQRDCRGARLCLRLHHPRAGAARPRPALGSRGTRHRQPRPRDVVPPARPGRRLAAVRPAGGRRGRRARAGHGPLLRPRRRSPGHRGPRGNDPHPAGRKPMDTAGPHRLRGHLRPRPPSPGRPVADS